MNARNQYILRSNQDSLHIQGKEKGKKIIDGRLASYLGVDCFYMPRTSYSGDVPVISFPTIHVCSNLKCGRLFDARDNFDLERYL